MVDWGRRGTMVSADSHRSRLAPRQKAVDRARQQSCGLDWVQSGELLYSFPLSLSQHRKRTWVAGAVDTRVIDARIGRFAGRPVRAAFWAQRGTRNLTEG